MVKISIVIPVFNSGETIVACIESIQTQGFDDVQIITVDDCSRDNSSQLIAKLALLDKRIRMIRCQANHGPMWARMLGYSAAEGEYVIFCDADDHFPAGALSTLYESAVSTRSDIIIGNIHMIGKDGQLIDIINRMPYGESKEGLFKALLSKEISQSLCGKIFRKCLFDRYLYSEDHQNNGEDGWLLYQLVSRAESVSLIDDFVYCYVLNENSTTHQRYSEDALKAVIKSNIARVNIAMAYSGVRSFASRHLIINMSQWLYEGYQRQFVWETYQNLGGDKSLVGFKSLFSFFSFREIVEIITKIVYGGVSSCRKE